MVKSVTSEARNGFQRWTILRAGLFIIAGSSGLSAPATSRGAHTFDFPTATIADINHAMAAGALTSERLVRLTVYRLAGSILAKRGDQVEQRPDQVGLLVGIGLGRHGGHEAVIGPISR